MVEDHIRNIEDRVEASSDLPQSAKAEMRQLIAELRAELDGVNREHLDRAETTGSGASLHDPALDKDLGGLKGTVTELETTHPRLAELANRIAMALSNMGI